MYTGFVGVVLVLSIRLDDDAIIHTMRHYLHRLPTWLKKFALIGLDLVLVPFSLWAALSLRLGQWLTAVNPYLLPVTALSFFTVALFIRLGLYRMVVRYIGWRMMEPVAKGVAGSAGILLAIMLIMPGHVLPRSTFVLYGLVLFPLIAGSRWLLRKMMGEITPRRLGGKPIAIYGAGGGGRQLVTMLRSGIEYRPVAFLDDDITVQGRTIDGIDIYAPSDERTLERLQRLGVKEVLLSIPSLGPAKRRQILERLDHWPFHVRTVPGLHDIMVGRARLDDLQDIRIEDLLGRDPIPPMAGLLHRCIEGRAVLVTGAGGSIGSELCRQALELNPRALVLLEQSEYALYRIELELREQMLRTNTSTELVALLGSVQDTELLSRIFSTFSIETVYHAAAYKHVPLVEHNSIEGVRNNVIGTLNTALAARSAGVKYFVLISTDKAVRPTNIMGASKRMAELAVQALAADGGITCFSIVRFGNVLGSSGSVVPLFREQIARGGPITLTHPEVTRYFMTIPEAVQLVIQAGAMAAGGDVFVLDMGESVKIGDLAVRMVRLSGLEVRDDAHPDGTIAIDVTGLRPGEKLYEELLIGGAVFGTEHPRIMRAEEEYVLWSEYASLREELEELIKRRDADALRHMMARWVAGYTPSPHLSDSLFMHEQRSTNS